MSAIGHPSRIALQSNQVLVEATRSMVDSHCPDYCSLYGRVARVGSAVDSLQLGDTVVTMGTPVQSMVLSAGDCFKLPETEFEADEAACCALALTLVRVIRHCQLELGETVLILGSGLVGQMLARLTFVAGAVTCVGLDLKISSQVISSDDSLDCLWVNDEVALEEALPADGFDLLIDATGDPRQLKSHLSRVVDGGRVLLVGECHPAKSDFDFYPDLHRRSIKLLSNPVAKSLADIDSENGSGLINLDQMLNFVRYLFQTHSLLSPGWPLARLQAPDADALEQALQNTEGSALLIEWPVA